MKRTVLVCGGRDFDDVNLLWETLDAMHASKPIWLIVNGGARGADLLSTDYAKARDLAIHVYDADWKTHGRAAGPIRNRKMLDSEAVDIVVAFPGGRGTRDMVQQAEARGIDVVEVSR